MAQSGEFAFFGGSFGFLPNQHNVDFKGEQEKSPVPEKKQKIENIQSFNNIFTEEESGLLGVVSFYSDEKNVITYSSSVLNCIPVLKIVYNEGKEQKIKLDEKYVNILPWIVSIFKTKTFAQKLVEFHKTKKIDELDVCSIMDFINHYIVDISNTFEKLCTEWMETLINYGLFNSNDVNYVCYLYNLIKSRCEGPLVLPYKTVFNNIIKKILNNYIIGRNKGIVDINKRSTLPRVLKEEPRTRVLYDFNFDYNMISRIPEPYKSTFIIDLLNDITQKSNVNGIVSNNL
jgi:hypothetical protein